MNFTVYILAQAGSQHDAAHQGGPAAHTVHQRGACEIVKRCIKGIQKTAAPLPHADNRVTKAEVNGGEQQEGLYADTLGHRTRDDSHRRCCKHGLENKICPVSVVFAVGGCYSGGVGAYPETGKAKESAGELLTWIHQAKADQGVAEYPDRDDAHVLEQDVDRVFFLG